MDKEYLQEELKKRGEKLTMCERMLKVEILLENHLTHHDRLTRYILYPILAGVVVSVVLSIITLIVTHGGFGLKITQALVK